MEKLDIRHTTSLIKHPQNNEKKKKLGATKKKWTEKLLEVIWSTDVHIKSQESNFPQTS